MSRQKLKRFALNAQCDNILEPGKDLFETIKGKWHSVQFKNQNPITLELGCGQGEYTVGLAQFFPQRNFIGIDIKGNRIWNGSNVAYELNLNNVAFIRTKIQNIEDLFVEGEIDEIWITFPDPRLKNRDRRRRLTSPRFLGIYKRLLASGGIVHLKTDSTDFFDYTREVMDILKISPVNMTRDLYQNPEAPLLAFDIKTKYEKVYLQENKPIKYLSFCLDGVEIDEGVDL